jgi:hypothetical protein
MIQQECTQNSTHVKYDEQVRSFDVLLGRSATSYKRATGFPFRLLLWASRTIPTWTSTKSGRWRRL